MSAKLEAIPTVKIDEEGVYKYIQIKVKPISKNIVPAGNQSVLLSVKLNVAYKIFVLVPI